MLPKNKRISKNNFLFFQQNSRAFSSPTLSLRAGKISSSEKKIKVSFVVSKKIAKTAVLRNKFRRLGYEAIKKIESKIRPGFFLIFYLKKDIKKISLRDLSIEIENLLKAANLLLS